MLWEYDILGSPGCQPFANSILVGDLKQIDDGSFKRTQFVPSGCSTSQALAQWFSPSLDLKLDTIKLIWDSRQIKPQMTGKFFIRFLEDAPLGTTADFRATNGSMIFPVDRPLNNSFHWLELFSGGYAGWSRAIHLLRDHFGVQSKTIGIESDIHIAHSLAVSLQVPLIDGTRPLHPKALDQIRGDCVIHADVTSSFWQQAVAFWRPDGISISGPCQPWSNASTGPGLNTIGGMASAEAVAICKFLRPKFICYETVAGFVTHDHYRYIMAQFHWAGFQLKWAKLIDCAEVLPTHRIRWLALFIRIGDPEIHALPFQLWTPSTENSPSDYDAIMDEYDTDSSLSLSEELQNLASRKAFLPPGQRTRISVDAVFESRCNDGSCKTQTFMASYGSQHRFSEKDLEARGLLAHFYLPPSKIARHWHPVEILAIHAAYGNHFISSDMTQAYLILGNQITIPHALLLIVNCFRMIPSYMPTLNVDDVLHKLNEVRFKCTTSYCLEMSTGQLVSSRPLEIASPQIRNIETFCDGLEHEQMPSGHYWTFDGFQPWTFGQLTSLEDGIPLGQPQPDFVEPSPISQFDEEVVTPTLHFTPMLMGKIRCVNGDFKFWFAGDLPFEHVLSVWSFEMKIASSSPSGLGCSLILEPAQDLLTASFSNVPILCAFRNGVLTLFAPDEASQQAATEEGRIKLYDQFGEFSSRSLNPLLFLHPFADLVSNLDCTGDYALYLQAVQVCTCRIKWNPFEHTDVMHFCGPHEATIFLALFWSSVLKPSSIEACGFRCQTLETKDGHTITFEPSSDKCPVPYHAFRVLLAVAAFRFFIRSLQQDGQLIALKWLSRPLWNGSVDPNIRIETILKLADAALFPFTSQLQHRLVHKGQQAIPERTVSEFVVPDTSHNPLLFHVIAQCHGGGGQGTTTKAGHRIQVKNSLASVLLEEGFELKWVSECVESLIDKHGLKGVSGVSSMPPGPAKFRDLKQLLEQCNISIPANPTKLTSQHAFVAKQRRKQAVMPIPANYRIKPGYLVNEDGSPAIQLDDFVGQTSGVMLCSPSDSLAWLREGKKISSDELALAVIGDLPLTPALDWKRITIPCLDFDSREVLLACCLVQFGGKPLLPKALDTHTVPAEGTSLVAATLWKQDWGDDWKTATQNPIQFLKQIINAGDSIVAIWGKSFRKGRSPCSPSEATSIQLHFAIKDTSLTEVLKTSGFNKVWLTPKSQDGQPSDRWKLIWLSPDTDIAQCKVVAASISGFVGITRSRDKFALRIEKAHFDSAWDAINPGVQRPKDVATTHVYKVDSLPFGTTSTMLQTWADHYKWPIRPLRATGPKGWVIGCATAPPSSQMAFNGNPILVRKLEPRISPVANPVIAGPRPTKDTFKRDDRQTQLVTDPWAAWQGPRPAPNISRAAQGPQEAKFSQQDDRIHKLEQALEQVQITQQDQSDQVKQLHQEVKQQEASTKQHIDLRLQQIRSELDQSFSSALQQQSRQFEDNMRDLKQLLGGVPKRKTPEDNDTDM